MQRNPTTWAGVAFGLILLTVLLVFILQNLQEVKVSFFWVNWRAPLAVDLLFATVLGGLVVFVAGSVRILQLRKVARRRAEHAGGEHPGGGAEGREEKS